MTKREKFLEWTRLIDIPADYARPLTAVEDAERIALEAELYPAPIDPLEGMRARFGKIEAALVDADTEGEFLTISVELTELKAAIDKMHGAADDYADGRMMAHELSDTY